MTTKAEHFAGTGLLIVLDGWGYREEPEDNAIAQANTPVWDRLWQEMPHCLLACSGSAVGLPENQMGSSEVGHLNLGAGRVVQQELTQISQAVAAGTLKDNSRLQQAIASVIGTAATLHVFGLLSAGGVHSHEHHIHALLKIAAAAGVRKTVVHAFLDGRDTPPQSAAAVIDALEQLCSELNAQGNTQATIGSLCGRYFAMDRDARWDRTQRAYDLLVSGTATHRAPSALDALQMAYAAGESDEFVQPALIVRQGAGADETPCLVRDKDAVVFMNFRADRARQLTRAFVQSDFADFARARQVALADFATLTSYADDLKARAAFPPQTLGNTLGEYMAGLGKTQLRVAETEKYAHVTFFFSGGQEAPYLGEDRVFVPSPKVATYDLQPQMSAAEVADVVVQSIQQKRHDLVVCNFANSDMVGHTGVFSAAVRAVETLDACLGRILDALAEAGSGHCLITADHGNVEQMRDVDNKQPHTAHTCAPVPLLYAGPKAIELCSGGRLSDVAPTLLTLMGIAIPAEMTGRSLLR